MNETIFLSKHMTDSAREVGIRQSAGICVGKLELKATDIDDIHSIIIVFEDTNTEKRLLFINELIDYLSPVLELVRFSALLGAVSDFTDKCNNWAFRRYVTPYSVAKLTTCLLAKKCSSCFSSINKDNYLPIYI